MKINLMDGGMIFEINKKYNDYGQEAIINDKELIDNLYQSYINLGSKYITTCNYCFTPNKIMDSIGWEKYTEESIACMKKFRNDGIQIFGSVPPYFRSYNYGDINQKFCDFYNKLIRILMNKVDFYFIETAIEFTHINKIIEIIRSIDLDTKIIVSIYPNESNSKNIDKILKLEIYGLFINCCSFDDLKDFYCKNLKGKNFENKKFGFQCNKIDEKKYSVNTNIKELQCCYVDKNISKNKLNEFLKSFDFDEVFIGGCCGYGVKEMKELSKII